MVGSKYGMAEMSANIVNITWNSCSNVSYILGKKENSYHEVVALGIIFHKI